MARRGNLRAAHWSATPVALVLGPMQRFINRAASGGIVLLGATLLALGLDPRNLVVHLHLISGAARDINHGANTLWKRTAKRP
jgi:hypothetical protein